MARHIKLSVIIPAYNEADNFKAGKLDEVNQYLSQQNYSWEVIVVDDGSRDNTSALVTKFVKNKPYWHFIHNRHYGKAKTVETGMRSARGDIRLFTDFDQATPISEAEKVLAKFDQGFQVIIGSREAKGASRHYEPFLRHLMGRVFNLLVRIIALRGIHDSQCGFKAFSASATKDLFNRLVVYKNRQAKDAYTGAFDVELLFLARKLGYKYIEIPVKWTYVATSRVSPAKDSIRMLLDIIKIRLAYLLGKYK